MAEQSAHMAQIVTMVDMKIAFAAGVISFARRAFTFLLGQSQFVPTYRNAVPRFENMVFSQARIFCAPFFRDFTHLRQILKTPFVVAFSLTGFAVNLVTTYSRFGFVVIFQRLGYKALRAGFKTGRQVEIDSARHESFPFFAQHNKLSYAVQG